MDKPYIDTLWIRCLFEVAKSVQENGETEVKFEEVDKLVLQKASLPINELKKYLEESNGQD